MKLTIELSPAQEARLFAAARREGTDLPSLAQKLLTDHLPEIETDATKTPKANSAIGVENAAAIALLDSWLAQDATDDPEEIRQAEEEFEQFKSDMNANRAATGERLVFP